MGNANGREDGNGSSTTPTLSPSHSDYSESEQEEIEEASGRRRRRTTSSSSSSSVLPHHPPPSAAAAVVQSSSSPPSSPRPPPTHSPFLFTPQVPVLPLQRPHDNNNNNNNINIHAHAHAHAHASSGYEYQDMYGEQGIPTIITWSYGANQVSVEGSWDNWKTRMPLQRSGKDFAIMKVLPSGVYHYRFIVDGQSRFTPDLPSSRDDAGNAFNILDLQDYVPEDIGSISSFEPPQSPDSSYNNLELGSEDYSKEPPVIPPHLQNTLLNVPATNMEIQPPMSRPQHGVLNHLYMQKGKSSPSVVALGTTHRFLAKYVTVVLYKSLQR
ncbi:hypothetical protein RIF29_08267 [Crotalaria pallida]|uniref:Association with the SNF1 complex (ASC) domain-containing protein n=1 Tax=Crotalaria pallida TaxID=3830 RepID=A0AAN9J6M1_CROPI